MINPFKIYIILFKDVLLVQLCINICIVTHAGNIYRNLVDEIISPKYSHIIHFYGSLFWKKNVQILFKKLLHCTYVIFNTDSLKREQCFPSFLFNLKMNREGYISKKWPLFNPLGIKNYSSVYSPFKDF